MLSTKGGCVLERRRRVGRWLGVWGGSGVGLLGLATTLFLKNILRTRGPLPTVRPRPRRIALSAGQLGTPRNFALSNVRRPSRSTVHLVERALSVASGSRTLPLGVASLRSQAPRLGHSKTCLLIVAPRRVSVTVSSDHNLFCTTRALRRLTRASKRNGAALPLKIVGSCPSITCHKAIRNFCNSP